MLDIYVVEESEHFSYILFQLGYYVKFYGVSVASLLHIWDIADLFLARGPTVLPYGCRNFLQLQYHKT
jgi:hypothetical protein